MTVQLAVDKINNDLIMKEGGGVERVTDGRYVVQLCKNRLQLSIGDWLLDSSKGWLTLGDLNHRFNAFDIEVRARRIIADTPGVLSILSLTSDFEDRILTLSFSAETEFGIINLDIPWKGA